MRIPNDKIKQRITRLAEQKVQKKVITPKMTPEEQFKTLIVKGREVLANMVSEFVPEKGRLQKNVSVSFDIPATNNHTIIKVEESAGDKLLNRDLIVGVRHKQRDRLTSNLILSRKQKQEIVNYLKSAKSQSELEEAIKRLSKRTDDFYNEL